MKRIDRAQFFSLCVLLSAYSSATGAQNVPFFHECAVASDGDVACKTELVQVEGSSSKAIERACESTPNQFIDCPRFINTMLSNPDDPSLARRARLVSIGQILDSLSGVTNASSSYWPTMECTIAAVASLSSGRPNIVVFGQHAEYYVAAFLLLVPHSTLAVSTSCIGWVQTGSKDCWCLISP